MRRLDLGPLRRASYAGGVRSAFPRLHGLALVVVLVLSACAASGSPAPAEGADAALFDGQAIYERQCASCHRADGSGGRGPRLNRDRVLVNYETVEDQIQFLEVGRGAMPGFGSRLDAAELDAVVRYTREVLANTG